MQRICPIDVSAALPCLALLTWQRSGTSPWDGAYGMLGWPFISPVAVAMERLIWQVLEYLPGRRRGTAFLARMTPGQRHPLHTDAEDDGCDFRVHVPLVTNPQAIFMEAGETFHMPVGWAYRIDPTKEHTAWNGGTEDRFHLMFNAVLAHGDRR